MADSKKPIEEVSAEDAQAMFANAAKALGGSAGRSAGFRRVSIPVSEPVRPEPLPKEEPKAADVVEEVIDGERYVAPAETSVKRAEPEKNQSKRKAWYLRRRKEEEQLEQEEAQAAETQVAETQLVSLPEEPEAEDHYEERFDFGATAVIPSAVVFDYYDDEEYDEDSEGDEDDYELTQADVEEEVAFSALEAALNRHKEVYGDNKKGRRKRYHDYGFGMGISFDGPDDDDYDD